MKKLAPGSTHLFIAVVCLIISGCGSKQTTHFNDYAKYLQEVTHSRLVGIDEEIGYWQKRFVQTPDDIIARTKIASLLTQRFSYSANIAELHAADSLYQLVNQLNRINSSATYRSLAANAITQHRFKQAALYIDSALALGDDKYLSVLMEFDVALELGNTQKARKALNSLIDKQSFEYLIREAKYKDHAEGDLDGAIQLMEQAFALVENGNNIDTWLWAKSNLADMYGHANRFEESYAAYLEVLEREPEYYHALKGIAWLAFSRDNDYASAKKIVRFLKDVHPSPDYDLLLAEIAAAENDETGKLAHLRDFVTRVNNVMYGDMYNKYLFTLRANEFDDLPGALQLAEKEVANRPTGEAFSWLAYAYLKNGQKEMALKTARYYVENHSFEPDAMYYVGKIYQAAGNNKKARQYLEAAYESRYELGPSAAAEIAGALKKL
jgi:predicted Zn-dependent protease